MESLTNGWILKLLPICLLLQTMLQWASVHIHLCTHILVGQIPGCRITRSRAKLKPFFGFIIIPTFVYCTICLTLFISQFISINASPPQQYIRFTRGTLKITYAQTAPKTCWIRIFGKGLWLWIVRRKPENSNAQQRFKIIDLYIKQNRIEI